MKPNNILKQLIFSSTGLLFSSYVCAQEKPNVIIILADDMGYGDAHCNNPYAKSMTPAIDRLASEGIRFTDAHSAGSLSGPSRYGLVTGRYFFRETKKKEYWGYLGSYLQPDRLTIGSMMQNAGYTTGCIGKWHLGLDWEMKDPNKPHILSPDKFDYTNTNFKAKVHASPYERGFDYSFILPASLDMPPYVFVKNDEVVDPNVILTADAYPNTKPGMEEAWDRKHTKESDIYWERGVWWRNGEMSKSFKFEECLPTIAKEGISFIEREGKKDKPFFLYLPLTGPHTPWLPEDQFKGKTRLGVYGDFICTIDNVVNKVTETLKKMNIEENTIIIFASDNGAAWEEEDIQKYSHQANWSRRGEKGDAWDGGHHIPLIVKWPKGITKADVSNRTVGLVDIYATLAEITGQKLVEGQAEDSFSFLPILKGNMNAETRDHLIYLPASRKLAIKEGNWKFIDALGSCGFSFPKEVKPVKDGPKGQLYDLSTDLKETTNLYLSEPEKVKHLSNRLKELVESGHSRKY